MNAEAAFAQTLRDDEQEKLSAHFDAYSADELAELLKESSLMPMQQAPASKGYVQREQTKGGRIVNRIGDALSMPKMSSAEMADAWGRELAHADVASTVPSRTKLAFGAVGQLPMPGKSLSAGLKPQLPTAPKIGVGSMPKVGAARLRDEMDKVAFWGSGMIASGINKAAPYLAKGVNAVRNASMGQAAGIGAGVGALAGAGRHMLSRPDPQTGQKRTTLLGSMAGGAAGGAALGLGARAGAQRFHGTGLHARMTGGNFQFAGKAPQQGSLPLGGAAGPIPQGAPAPQQSPSFMQRVRGFFGGGAAPAPKQTVMDVNMGGGAR